jgi:glycosyltransferase involved in cell wall biosynthesis
LARRGHDVHIFTAAWHHGAVYEESAGLHIHRLPALIRIGNAPVLPSLLSKLRGFDIVHLHFPFFGGEIAALMAALYHTPLVITYHQDVLLSGLIGLAERLLRLSVGRLTLRSARRVLFTSLDYGHMSYVRPLLRGREQRIDHLANGVDTLAFQLGDSPTDLRIRYDLAPDDQVALLVATLDRAHYFKGIDIFLQALAQAPQQVKGLIVGDGDLRASYTARAQEIGVLPRVRFAGRVSEEDLPRYYRLADLTVLPSTTMGEAFGLVLVESLASGTPVIATNLPGVRTVVNHGIDGLLVEPGDPVALAKALEWMLSDDQRRQAMGTGGRAKVEACYDWTHIGERLEAIYWQVLECSPVHSLPSLRGKQ